MMTRRERVLTAIDHQEPDRVPLGFDANAGILAKLFEHYGVEKRLDMYDAMGIDGFSVFCDSYVYPDYVGPDLVLPDGTRTDIFGIACQKHEPLAFAETIEDLDRYRWPQPDWFRYDTIRRRCLEIKQRGMVTVGGEGGCGIAHATNLRGYVPALTDPLLRPEFTHEYMTRMGEFLVEWNSRWLAAAGGEFDIYRCGDDTGNSSAMHVSPGIWREFYKPQMQRIWAIAKKHNLKIWFHDCGCCRPIFDDLIEMGIDMWDPVPGYVAGNDQRELKQRYGQAITFVGGVDHPNVLVKGSVREVQNEVRRCLDIFAPGGGYILCGSQVLTDDIPVENVVAMYETALKYGEH